MNCSKPFYLKESCASFSVWPHWLIWWAILAILMVASDNTEFRGQCFQSFLPIQPVRCTERSDSSEWWGRWCVYMLCTYAESVWRSLWCRGYNVVCVGSHWRANVRYPEFIIFSFNDLSFLSFRSPIQSILTDRYVQAWYLENHVRLVVSFQCWSGDFRSNIWGSIYLAAELFIKSIFRIIRWRVNPP